MARADVARPFGNCPFPERGLGVAEWRVPKNLNLHLIHHGQRGNNHNNRTETVQKGDKSDDDVDNASSEAEPRKIRIAVQVQVACDGLQFHGK